MNPEAPPMPDPPPVTDADLAALRFVAAEWAKLSPTLWAGEKKIGEALGRVLADRERADMEVCDLAGKLDIARSETAVEAYRAERAKAERDALIAAWPGCNGNSGPVIYNHSDGTVWLETVAGDRWKRCPDGPYPDRLAAIRAHLDSLAPAPGEGGRG